MPDHLYRFRSLDALLGVRQELDRGEIYFAAPEQLNDPMEGYLDVVWRGDAILWRNLLRHYALCLLHAGSLALLTPDMDEAFLRDMGRRSAQDIADIPLAALHAELCRDLLESPVAAKLLDHLARLERSVSREELLFYLSTLHPFVLACLLRLLVRRGLMPSTAVLPTALLDPPHSEAERLLSRLASLGGEDEELIHAGFSAALSVATQITLINDYQVHGAQQTESWKVVTRTFANHYVTSLEGLIYPQWRVACFGETADNASMWGVYGDSHTGVCLKFKSRMADGFQGLRMNAHVGWGGGRDDEHRAIYGQRPFRFEPVRYDAVRPRLEFFLALGVLPRVKMNDWVLDEEGKPSPLVRPMFDETPVWREAYWRDYAAGFAVKTPEWAHEREYRLVMEGGLDHRKPHYLATATFAFEDLVGVIFGVRTPEAKKIEIMRIIEAKCRESGHRDFEFHQARYEGRGSKLIIAPLGLLKFDWTTSDQDHEHV
ncbi:MAG TPA: hypothetical protein VN158_16645 [Caulobacter sp.]|nr:hypothetical protein [Caulobacter sp.]